jgi:hypothetical protein
MFFFNNLKDDPVLGSGETGALLAYFDIGSAAMRPILDAALWQSFLTQIASEHSKVRLVGFTDCQGTERLNQDLRKQRAMSVFNILPAEVKSQVISLDGAPIVDCVTKNNDENERGLNRSVALLIEQRTVNIDPEDIEATPPRFVCGPDVTQQVSDAVELTRTIFKGWSKSQREDACSALISLRAGYCSWDIENLHLDRWISRDFQPKKCATTGAKPACGESIQINEDCYYAGSVNYVIFGTMFKLCSDENPNISYNFAKRNMDALIDIYKGSRPSGLGTPSPDFKAGLAWANAGYDGWSSGGPSPPGDRNNCVPICPAPYSAGPFTIHWWPHKPGKEWCDPSIIGAVHSL